MADTVGNLSGGDVLTLPPEIKVEFVFSKFIDLSQSFSIVKIPYLCGIFHYNQYTVLVFLN
jgi:hypothetical protein